MFKIWNRRRVTSLKTTGKGILREHDHNSQRVEHKQSSSIPQTPCMGRFLLALLVHTASVQRLAGSICRVQKRSVFKLCMLNDTACVHELLLNGNWTIWGEHSQICVHSFMKKVEILQSDPVELLHNIIAQYCFNDRCIGGISRVMYTHVSVFANIWSCHVYKSSRIMYISWGWKCSST